MLRWTAIILDIDGTLLLSNKAHALAFVEAGAQLHLPVNFQEVLRLIGKGGDKLIPEAFGIGAKTSLGRKLAEAKGEIFRLRYLPFLQPAPGSRALLTKLREDDIRLVVATSGSKRDAPQLLEQAGVGDLIENITAAEDAEASKPDPDILLAALKKLDIGAKSVVMLGDTPYDIEAALRAKMHCITLRCGGWTDPDLGGSFAIYDDPADLAAHYDQSFYSRPQQD